MRDRSLMLRWWHGFVGFTPSFRMRGHLFRASAAPEQATLSRIVVAAAVCLEACGPGAASERVHRPTPSRSGTIAQARSATVPAVAQTTTSIVTQDETESGSTKTVAQTTTSIVTQDETESGSTKTVFDAYASEGDALGGWSLALARRGKLVRVILKPNLTSGVPIELWGTASGQAEQRRIDAHVRTSKQELTLSATQNRASNLLGTLVMGTVRAAIDLERHTAPAFAEKTAKEAFGVMLGASHRFRLDWLQSGVHAKATLSRLGVPPRVFEGTLETNRFELQERANKTSQLRGILLGPGNGGLGEWTNSGITVPFTLDRFYPTYPPITKLHAGGRVAPSERLTRDFPDCETSYDIFPVFEGAVAERALNAQFEKLVAPRAYCIDAKDPSDLGNLQASSTYSITAARDNWVGLSFESNWYAGGMRGSHRETCAAVDTLRGIVVHLNEEFTPSAFEKLALLAKRAILKATRERSLQDIGFFTDDLHINAKREMCVVEVHGALFLELRYQSDDDEAGNFRLNDIRPRLAAAVVRPFFPAGSLGARVFQ